MDEANRATSRDALLARAKRHRERAARYRDVASFVGNRQAADAMCAEADALEREAETLDAQAAALVEGERETGVENEVAALQTPPEKP